MLEDSFLDPKPVQNGGENVKNQMVHDNFYHPHPVVIRLRTNSCKHRRFLGNRSTSEPSIVKIGYAGSPDTLNPGTAILSEAYVMFELAYSALFGQNLDGTYSLDLLESFEVSPDGKTYTFKT